MPQDFRPGSTLQPLGVAGRRAANPFEAAAIDASRFPDRPESRREGVFAIGPRQKQPTAVAKAMGKLQRLLAKSHTYGFAWISYFIASMPAMFFVAGSLMAYSLQKDGPRRVMYTRFRRLLVPL